MTSLTYEQVSIMGSCLGVNVYGDLVSTKKKKPKLPKEFYRNRFMMFNESNHNYPTLKALADIGLTEEDRRDGQVWFFVTLNGEQEFRKWYTILIQNTCSL